MARLSGKLTAKTLGWGREEIGPAVKKIPQTERVFIGRFAGIVSGIKEIINDDTGEIQTGLKGQFRGISTLDDAGENVGIDDNGNPVGRVVTAGVCYLPSGLQDVVEGAYRQAVEHEPRATISFVMDLFAMFSGGQAGYTYDAETKVDAQQADPLDILLEQAATPLALTDESDSKAKVK